MKNKGERIKVKCPVCQRDLDGRGFKNHMYNEHNYTKAQAEQAWLAATGRNPISWKAMQKQQPYVHRTSSPPESGRELKNEEWAKAFKEGFDAGFEKGLKVRNIQ